MDEKINLLIADDDKLFIDLISYRLSTIDGLNIVGIADDGEKTLAKIYNSLPEIVLLDISMPKLGGMDIIIQVKKEFPQIKFLILTSAQNPDLMENALELGASGYLIKKKSSVKMIIDALKAVVNGGIYFQQLKEELDIVSLKYSLSDLEISICNYIIIGKTSEEIAEILNIKENSVKYYRKTIYKKLGVGSKLQLQEFCKNNGIF